MDEISQYHRELMQGMFQDSEITPMDALITLQELKEERDKTYGTILELSGILNIDRSGVERIYAVPIKYGFCTKKDNELTMTEKGTKFINNMYKIFATI